jgi:hypothetical protein
LLIVPHGRCPELQPLPCRESKAGCTVGGQGRAAANALFSAARPASTSHAHAQQMQLTESKAHSHWAPCYPAFIGVMSNHKHRLAAHARGGPAMVVPGGQDGRVVASTLHMQRKYMYALYPSDAGHASTTDTTSIHHCATQQGQQHDPGVPWWHNSLATSIATTHVSTTTQSAPAAK